MSELGQSGAPEAAIADAAEALRDVLAHKREGGFPAQQPSSLSEVVASGEIGESESAIMVPLLLDCGRIGGANAQHIVYSAWLAVAARVLFDARGGAVTKVETNVRKVVERLKADGWTNIGGGSHDRFIHRDRPEMLIVVPRHRELSPGVARSIAKAVGWL